MTRLYGSAPWTLSLGLVALLMVGCDAGTETPDGTPGPVPGATRAITPEEAAKLNISPAPADADGGSAAPVAEESSDLVFADSAPQVPGECNAYECLISEEIADVNEAAQFDVRLINTRLNFFDRVEITASGEIWAGVWFTGTNGPDGWVGWRAGNDYPLPFYAPFGLVGRRDGRAFWVGRGTSFRYYGLGTGLSFIVNDNVHGNGSGAFQVVVRVYRERSRM